MVLSEIADIYVGATFRSGLKASPKGSIRVIQLKDLRDRRDVDMRRVASIEDKNLSHLRRHQHLKIGDILFRARGLTTTAQLLTKSTERVIASSALLIIRIKSDSVLPGYLVWWINQPASQAYFRACSEGSLTQMVSKQTLANLRVEIPAIETQECIAEFYNLAMQEQVLLTKIRIKRKRYAHAVMRQLALRDSNTTKLDRNKEL